MCEFSTECLNLRSSNMWSTKREKITGKNWENNNLYARNLILVKFFDFFRNFEISFFQIFLEILCPERFRKLREACRNRFHLFSSKTLRRIPSYDQKPSEVNEYLINEYLISSVHSFSGGIQFQVKNK